MALITSFEKQHASQVKPRFLIEFLEGAAASTVPADASLAESRGSRSDTSDHGFGIQPNQFRFDMARTRGKTVVAEAAAGLANPVWLPVSTNTLADGLSRLDDPDWRKDPARFYRITQRPAQN